MRSSCNLIGKIGGGGGDARRLRRIRRRHSPQQWTERGVEFHLRVVESIGRRRALDPDGRMKKPVKADRLSWARVLKEG